MIKRSVKHFNPTITNAASNVLQASKADRSYLLIRNGTAGDILINLEGATITALIPSASNPGLTLKSNEWFESLDEMCPISQITVWQASGSSTNLITVIEG